MAASRACRSPWTSASTPTSLGKPYPLPVDVVVDRAVCILVVPECGLVGQEQVDSLVDVVAQGLVHRTGQVGGLGQIVVRQLLHDHQDVQVGSRGGVPPAIRAEEPRR